MFKQFTKNSNLLFGVKHNAISADNNTLYGGVSSDQNDNSNAAFEQKERIFAGYAQFAAAYKKLNYEVGLRYEYVATKEFPTNIKRNYSDLFPYVSIGYDIDEYGQMESYRIVFSKDSPPIVQSAEPYENADIVVYLYHRQYCLTP